VVVPRGEAAGPLSRFDHRPDLGLLVPGQTDEVDPALEQDPPAFAQAVLNPEFVAGAEDDLTADGEQVLQLVVGDLLEQREAAQLRRRDHVDAR
jgi:hypothetical protein